ncbi:hypothetical protein [Streptomyces sp. Wb2n-11]|uniref:hypothetical protein n=1 Tax=Streptomyces sp. Wb2n-11 TaxID=1030533 RepID=UPI000A96F48A|nr:hypothetical protein [Streptomyces sp. Wb2n-11]
MATSIRTCSISHRTFLVTREMRQAGREDLLRLRHRKARNRVREAPVRRLPHAVVAGAGCATSD